MKICVIAPSVIPILGRRQKYGGLELVVYLATEELVRRGHDVYLFALGDSETSAKLVPIVDEAIGQGVSYEREKEANAQAYKMAIAERPDIIWDHTLALHALDMIEKYNTVNYKVKMQVNLENLIDTGEIPVIHTLHGPARDDLPLIAQAYASVGHYFVTISHDQSKRYFTYIGKQELGTVYNAVDTNYYSVGKRGGKYLLWVGRFSFEKGAHIALSVAHEVGMPIRLVGKLAEEHEHKYFNTFVKPLLQTKDRLYTSVSLEKKAQLFRNAYATLMTTTWNEPFGLVAVESMASGTPVIAPNLGALPEIIDGTGVIVPVTDLNIHEELETMTSEQDEYVQRVASRVKNAGSIKPSIPRLRVENLFSVSQNTDGYEEAFAKAIYFKKARV